MKFLLFNVIVMGSLGYLYLAETGKDPSEALQNVQRVATRVVAKHVSPAMAPVPAEPAQPAMAPASASKAPQEPSLPHAVEQVEKLKGASRPAVGEKESVAGTPSPAPAIPAAVAEKAPTKPALQKSAAPEHDRAASVLASTSPVKLADDVPLMKPVERQRQLDSLIGDMERFFVDRLAK